jgi:transcriptional regulator of acetoin/glycerol metabolism
VRGYSLKQIEREAIVQALVFSDGNIKAAAKLLGVSVRSLHHKVRVVHQIPLPEYRKSLPRR